MGLVRPFFIFFPVKLQLKFHLLMLTDDSDT